MQSKLIKDNTDYRFKILYAIGIIIIVAGHCRRGGVSLFYDWFTPYAFHLGLFAFASGYFYKEKYEENPLKYVLKKFKTLIIPLYIWNFLYALLNIFLTSKGFTIGGDTTLHKLILEPILTGHQFQYNLSGWFVIPLFMIQVYNIITRKIFRTAKSNLLEIIYFLIQVGLGIFGVCISIKGYNTGWWLVLVRMLFFLPFFNLGIIYKKILEKYDRLPNLVYFAIVMGAQLLIIYIYEKQPYYYSVWCNNFVDGPILPFVVGVLGIAFWLRISKILTPSIGHSKLINHIADNTYSIMMHHLLAMILVKTGYALLYKFTDFAQGFDMAKYKSDIYYYFLPKNLDQTRIIYLVAGIALPLILQFVINYFTKLIKNIANRNKKKEKVSETISR